MTRTLLGAVALATAVSLVSVSDWTATPVLAQYDFEENEWYGEYEDEWYDPTDWFDGNNYEFDDSWGYYDGSYYDDDYYDDDWYYRPFRTTAVD